MANGKNMAYCCPCHLCAHTPPSVVLLWIHVDTGEAPTSLLQETLKL